METILKPCNRCGKETPLSGFYRNSSAPSGLQNTCKECSKAASAAYWKSGKGRIACARYELSDKGRANRLAYVESGKRSDVLSRHNRTESRKAADSLYLAKYPEKISARSALNNALRSGALKRAEGCWYCGSTKIIEAHHADYQNKLGVTWLCKKCHVDAHLETESYLAGDQETQAA